MPAVTGISDHIGWAELVTLAGGAGAPVILDRRRVRLIDPGLPSAPYHHEGLALPLDAVEPIIARTRASVLARCRSAVTALASSLQVGAVVVQESPYGALPDSVAQVLASYHMTCAADGMLYREALAAQAAAIGLDVHRVPRRSDPLRAASRALGCSASELAALLERFGKSVGPPWRKEHKHAAAAALCVLAGLADRVPG